MEVFKDKNYVNVFGNDNVFIIPTTDKSVKMIFSGDTNTTETISIKDAINRVKAASDDPYEFINILVKKGK